MNLYKMLFETSEKNPHADALIFRERVITYGELIGLVDKCTANLSGIGAGKGDSFGIVIRNCPEFVITFFALAKLGAACVPVNFLEKPERLKAIFADAGVTACLTSGEFLANVQNAVRELPGIRHIFVTDSVKDSSGTDNGLIKHFDKLVSAADSDTPASTGSAGLYPDDENTVAMLLYTSGTTGLPKGVMLTHRNFLSNVESCLAGINLTAHDKFLCLLPMFHSFAWTTCVLLPIRLGTSIVIIESVMPFEPVIKAIWHHKITAFVAVPPIYAAISSRMGGIKSIMLKFLNPVRVCISGAAAMPVSVAKAFEDALGIPIIEGYGLTEAAPVLTINPPGAIKLGTVGKAVPGVEIKIVDDNEKILATGEVGEICASGQNIMLGYRNQPGETKKAFTGDGWLKTGDLGCLDAEGYLTIVDRKKDLIIVKGLNVYPQEIETVLLSEPSVKEAAVVGIRDDTGDEVIKGFVILNDGCQTTKTDLLRLCREKLASYKCPKDIEIRSELPKNTLGKILKKDLREDKKPEVRSQKSE